MSSDSDPEEDTLCNKYADNTYLKVAMVTKYVILF